MFLKRAFRHARVRFQNARFCPSKKRSQLVHNCKRLCTSFRVALSPHLRSPSGLSLSRTVAGVCRKAPGAFPDSSSALDKFQSAITSYKSKWGLHTRFETFIARTACDSRGMRMLCKACAEAFSGPPSHISPKLCENCACTTFAQFLRKKWGSRTIFAHFPESPGTLAGSVLCTISTQFSQPGAIFLKSAISTQFSQPGLRS